eukprot:15733-Heterococcus_DN1.PRE.1
MATVSYAGVAVLLLAALGFVWKWAIVTSSSAVSTESSYCTSRDLEHENISFRIDKHQRVVNVAPRQCLLKRFEDDRESVASILKGKHLVIVGDSLSRYAYLQLVYFLETGNSTSPEPSQTWEKDYKSWNHFYQVTNKRLNGHEMCDCYRAETPKQAPLSKQQNGKAVKPIIIKQPPMIENRYYYNPDTQVRITYIQWFGSLGVTLHTSMWEAAVNPDYVLQPSELCAPGKCSAAAAPVMTVTALGFADLVLPSLQPDWVMWNCGLWPNCNLHPQALMAASLKALKNPRPRNVLWKTTTVQYNGVSANQTAVTAEFRQLHSRVMPAHRLTADLREAHEKVHKTPSARQDYKSIDFAAHTLFEDKMHFKPEAYRELNTLLLNMLAS